MAARKKDPSARARANQASTSAKLSASRTVPASRRPRLPARRNPDTGKAMAWHPMTREWWADLWASPMAPQYDHSDRHALFMLAALVDAFWVASSASARSVLAGEIRLQRMAFGLTPYDRRRLEWQIEATDEAQDRGRRRRESAPSKPAAKSAAARKAAAASDPRRVLHSVS